MASATEDMTNFMIWEIDRMGLLCLGKGPFPGHEDVSTSAAAAFGFIVEASISVGAEDHVTAAICGPAIRVGAKVVKKLVNGFSNGFSGSGLLGA